MVGRSAEAGGHGATGTCEYGGSMRRLGVVTGRDREGCK